jgi:acetyltransferase-like isoleucine patch superfamily enzyme
MNLYGGFRMYLMYLLGYIPSHTIRKKVLRMLGAQIDEPVCLRARFEVRSPQKLSIGANTTIGHGAVLDARAGLTIGSCVNFSSEVMVWTSQHDYRCQDFSVIRKSVVIEDYAWLGPRTIVLPGVTIGEGAVVGAGAVVTKNVSPYTVVGGVPAKVIASRPKELRYSLGKPAAFW